MSFWSVLGGLISGLVALFVALVGWRVQLIGKRRTEIAEEALLAFARAAEGLRMVRQPIVLAGEMAAFREEVKQVADKRLPGEDFRIALWRLAKQSDRFAECNKVQLLCKYHFGQSASDAFESLYQARHRVWVAGHMGASARSDNWQEIPENRQLIAKWERVIWQGAGEPDEIETMLSAAEAQLEAELTPHLRADAALLPIAIRLRAGREWTRRLFSRRKTAN